MIAPFNISNFPPTQNRMQHSRMLIPQHISPCTDGLMMQEQWMFAVYSTVPSGVIQKPSLTVLK